MKSNKNVSTVCPPALPSERSSTPRRNIWEGRAQLLGEAAADDSLKIKDILVSCCGKLKAWSKLIFGKTGCLLPD